MILVLVLLFVPRIIANNTISTNNNSIIWINVAKFDVQKVEPHGFTSSNSKTVYPARTAFEKGYVLGYFQPEPGYQGFVGRVGEGPVIQLQNMSNIEVIIYPSGSVSWYLVDGEIPLEKIHPNLISAGKDRSGSEDIYLCRALSGSKSVIIGTYLKSKGPICWLNKGNYLIESRLFEVLVINLFGEELKVQKP